MRRFLLCCGFLAAPSLAGAQDISGLTGVALDTLYGACLHDGFDASQVAPVARELDWGLIPSATLEALRPPVEQQFFDGWLAFSPDDPPLPFFLMVGRSIDGPDGVVDNCTTLFREVDAAEFLAAFRDETGAELLEVEEAFGERKHYFSIPDIDAAIVTISYPKRSKYVDLAAAVTYRKSK